ncbi:MAG: gas vesicle protein GvpN [Pseudomonadota bacterium]
MRDRIRPVGLTIVGANDGPPGAIMPPIRADLFEDSDIVSIQSRAMAYLEAGAPVHFRGPAGAGKTTLALQIAARVGRPVVLLTGDSALNSGDLVGREIGFESETTRDQFIHSVVKTKAKTCAAWADSALTSAMQHGCTLIYDEFTRAPAETNNALLSALEERILVIASPARQERCVVAHEQFGAIFTSNPEDYAGVNAAPDALFDRMITFDLSWRSEASEAGIVAIRSGLDLQFVQPVVRLIRALRCCQAGVAQASLRAGILICRIMAAHNILPSVSDERFVQLCFDVLETRAPVRDGEDQQSAYAAELRRQIIMACSTEKKKAATA